MISLDHDIVHFNGMLASHIPPIMVVGWHKKVSGPAIAIASEVTITIACCCNNKCYQTSARHVKAQPMEGGESLEGL